MVLELITNFQKLRHKPALMFIEAIVLTVLSVVFAVSLFPENYTSIAILAFLTIGALPLFNRLYSYDSYLSSYSQNIFLRHKRIIKLLFFFFLGVFVAFILVYFVAPANVQDKLLTSQFSELQGIDEIRESITGQATAHDVSGSKFKEVFYLIFKNNLLVVFTATVLSFFYGAGGLFLIAWNASILAAVLVKDIIISFSMASGSGLLTPLIGTYHSFISFLGFVPHGFFEVLAYFIVSVAGAVLARDLFRGMFTTDFRYRVIKDFIYLFIIAIICLIIGALIEACYFI